MFKDDHKPGTFLGSLRITKTLTPKDDNDKKEYTLLGMFGGKWNFPAVEVLPSQDFAWPQDKYFQPAWIFKEKAQDLIGRHATLEDMFWIAYAQWVQEMKLRAGEIYNPDFRLSLVEYRTPRFHMYLDMDFKDSQPMDDSSSLPKNRQWKNVVRQIVHCCYKTFREVYAKYTQTEEEIQEEVEFLKSCQDTPWTDAQEAETTLNEFVRVHPKTFFIMVLECQGNREIHVGDRVLYKRGLHLIWPNLVVDEFQAKCLCQLVEKRLEDHGPERNPLNGQNTYVEAVDKSVYATGLRLPGCPKAEKCKICSKNVTKDKKNTGVRSVDFRNEQEYLEMFCEQHRNEYPRAYDFPPESVYVPKYLFCGIYNFKTNPEKIVYYEFRQQVYLRKDIHIVNKPDVVPRAHKKPRTTSKPLFAQDVANLSLKTLCSIRSTATTTTPGFSVPDYVASAVISLPHNDPRHSRRYNPKNEEFVPYSDKESRMLSFPMTTPQELFRRGAFREDHEIVVDRKITQDLLKALPVFHDMYNKTELIRPMAFSYKLPALCNQHVVLHQRVRFCAQGEGSHYCLIKGARHTSNTVCFWFECGDGDVGPILYQSCWSKKYPTCRDKNTKSLNTRILYLNQMVRHREKVLEAFYALMNAPMRYPSKKADDADGLKT